MGVEDNQFIVTTYHQGGEHSDQTYHFTSMVDAMRFAWRKHNDPDIIRVELKSRRMTFTPWKVHTIHEPDHY